MPRDESDVLVRFAWKLLNAERYGAVAGLLEIRALVPLVELEEEDPDAAEEVSRRWSDLPDLLGLLAEEMGWLCTGM